MLKRTGKNLLANPAIAFKAACASSSLVDVSEAPLVEGEGDDDEEDDDVVEVDGVVDEGSVSVGEGVN